jgi:hypothetical protein
MEPQSVRTMQFQIAHDGLLLDDHAPTDWTNDATMREQPVKNLQHCTARHFYYLGAVGL